MWLSVLLHTSARYLRASGCAARLSARKSPQLEPNIGGSASMTLQNTLSSKWPVGDLPLLMLAAAQERPFAPLHTQRMLLFIACMLHSVPIPTSRCCATGRSSLWVS
jgi:hypothetical protein